MPPLSPATPRTQWMPKACWTTFAASGATMPASRPASSPWQIEQAHRFSSKETHMDRRKFFSVTGAGAAAAAASGMAETASAQSRRYPATPGEACASAKLPPLKARLGHQFGTLTDRTAAWVSRFGVDAVCTSPVVTDPARLYPTVEEMNKMLDIANKWKVKV